MTIEEKLNEPERVEIDKLQIDLLLELQAGFNAESVDKNNTPEEKEALKRVIKTIDRKIEEIDPLFFEQIKRAVD